MKANLIRSYSSRERILFRYCLLLGLQGRMEFDEFLDLMADAEFWGKFHRLADEGDREGLLSHIESHLRAEPSWHVAGSQLQEVA